MKLLSISVCLIFLMSNTANGAVLFSENFDAQADWEPVQSTIANVDVNAFEGEASIPPNWSNYRVDNTVYGANNAHQTLNISNENYRGASGKGLTLWHESGEESCGGGNHQCSDGMLGVLLSPPQTELWAEVYIKYDPTYAMAVTSSTEPMVKYFRITTWPEGSSTSPFQFFSAGVQHPLTTSLLSKWNNTVANMSYTTNFRYETEYYPDNATPAHTRNRTDYTASDGEYDGTGSLFNATGNIGDGNWYRHLYHVKMNSAVGVEDGVMEVWVDGRLIFSDSTLAWHDDGTTSPGKGWSMVMLGGNSFNEFDPVFTNYSEQYIAFDDLKVATTLADLDNPQTNAQPWRSSGGGVIILPSGNYLQVDE